ncbi:MAG: ATP-binding protein [Phycisphaerae bacterium]
MSVREACALTAPMTVKNTAFLLDRLGQDCHPLQFLRELTQNSIEAIGRSGKQGTILWDVDWPLFEQSGVKKLCIVDDGAGMETHELLAHINGLSSSSSQQSFSGNYGVGAKIAAATRNPAGLVYSSWVKGQGNAVWLWRNPDGVYGLLRNEVDGEFQEWIELDDSAKPEIVNEHGTKVTLHGFTVDDDTMNPPLNTPGASRWIAKFLNTRYFKFPKNVTVKAREGWKHPRADSKRNKFRTLEGQESYLNRKCVARGSVELDEAVAHWWILEDSNSLTQDDNYCASSGHVAALYKNELYELSSGRSGRARLQEFGITFGMRQVVIYVEPSVEQNRIITNTARTRLLIDNDELPWSDWAEQFRSKLPEELDKFINEKAANASTGGHSTTIRDRLKAYMDLYSLSRYRPTENGQYHVADDEIHLSRATPQERSVGNGTSRGKSRPSDSTDKTLSVFKLLEKKSGTSASKVRADPFPEVKWLTAAEGTRDPDDLADRAARFIEPQNLLLINGDFRVFVDMITRILNDIGDRDSVFATVQDAVRTWFEQALTETILGVQALRGSREWSNDQIRFALSEEALTASVMQRYHVYIAAKRAVSARIGRSSQITAVQVS